MSDDDLIRRRDALEILSDEGWLGHSRKRLDALPARGVGVKPLVDAVEALNAACDAMWNDHHRLEGNPSLFGQEMRIKEKHVKAITEAQQRLPAILAALAPTDAAQARPAWLSNCVVCGRIVDTRENDEGGDGHGCEYPEGWTCSSDCAEKLHPDPEWMKEGLAAQAREAALREAAAIADALSEKWGSAWKADTNDRHSAGLSDGAHFIKNAILALIKQARDD